MAKGAWEVKSRKRSDLNEAFVHLVTQYVEIFRRFFPLALFPTLLDLETDRRAAFEQKP